MSDFLKKKLYMMRLQEELNALEENEENKKQNLFIEQLQSLLDKHAYGMEDLKDMLDSAYSGSTVRASVSAVTGTGVGSGRGRPPGTKIPSHEIEYEGEVYKVNEKGRQPDETKQLLDKLNMSPTEFIEEMSPHPHEDKITEEA